MNTCVLDVCAGRTKYFPPRSILGLSLKNTTSEIQARVTEIVVYIPVTSGSDPLWLTPWTLSADLMDRFSQHKMSPRLNCVLLKENLTNLRSTLTVKNTAVQCVVQNLKIEILKLSTRIDRVIVIVTAPFEKLVDCGVPT